uniref:Gypsy-type retroelement n=1 Tax=Oryza sativa subsp. japonica TaxID=39947 RepID=Q94I56_ORYSJ|nr:Putative gypsy-type retroelement [Oryza sativa Japonica Group]
MPDTDNLATRIVETIVEMTIVTATEIEIVMIARADKTRTNEKIEFSDIDYPSLTTTPGRYPIVVKPTIQNVLVARFLIDGGSSINLLFLSALDAMGIPRSELIPSEQPFHGITPESSSRITTLTKFMAASHYAYQLIKIPGPKRIITVPGNAKMAVQCDKMSLDIVEQTTAVPPQSSLLGK